MKKIVRLFDLGNMDVEREMLQGYDVQCKACCDEDAIIEAAKDADALYTDIWASMGEEDQIPESVRMLTPYRVTKEMLDKTENPDVIFMHCLPSFHDFETSMAKEQMELGYDIREVTDDVFRSKHSVVFDEAENRMHTIKAVIVATIA